MSKRFLVPKIAWISPLGRSCATSRLCARSSFTAPVVTTHSFRSVSTCAPALFTWPTTRSWTKTQILTHTSPHSRGFRTSSKLAAKDFYDVLGVDKTASQAEIKKKYYELARKYHPDANPGDKAAEETFAQISSAYDTLKDTQTRAQYDATGGQSANGFGGGGGGFGGGQSYQNPEDIFNNIFGNFGNQQRGGNAPRRGPDIQFAMEISFDEAVTGVTRKLSYENRVSCDDCGGSGAKPGAKSQGTCHVCHGSGVEQMEMGGFIQYQSACRKCGGTGSIITDPCKGCRGRGFQTETSTVDVQIPAGVEDGMELRMMNKGHAGENGGPAGGLYIILQVQRSKIFEREGANVSSTVDISLGQAILGGKINVKGVQGNMNLKINPGTQSGAQSRLKGRGMPRVKSSSRGDHYVKFNVDIPKKITKKQKELMLEWAREEKSSGSVEGLDEYLEKLKMSPPSSPSSSSSSPSSSSSSPSSSSPSSSSSSSSSSPSDSNEGEEDDSFFGSLFGSSKKKEKSDTKKDAKERTE